MTIKSLSNFFNSIEEADIIITQEKVSKPKSQGRFPLVTIISFLHRTWIGRIILMT